jgi:hypothetical protein
LATGKPSVESTRRLLFHPRDHRHAEATLLRIPEAGIDERTVDEPQPLSSPA